MCNKKPAKHPALDELLKQHPSLKERITYCPPDPAFVDAAAATNVRPEYALHGSGGQIFRKAYCI